MHAHSTHVAEAVASQGALRTSTGRAAASEAETGQYVAFSSNGRNYAVDIMSVQEIRSWSPTTAIPEQHHASVGVMDIRGEVIQVFDLSALLGGERTDATEGHVVLVLTVGYAVAGVLVDAVSDIIQVSGATLQPPPSIGGRGRDGVVTGIVKQGDLLVAILDLSRVIGL